MSARKRRRSAGDIHSPPVASQDDSPAKATPETKPETKPEIVPIENPELTLTPVCRLVFVSTIQHADPNPSKSGTYLFGDHSDHPLERVRLLGIVRKISDSGHDLWLDDGTGIVLVLNTVPPLGPPANVGDLLEVIGELDKKRNVHCIACTTHLNPNVEADRWRAIVGLYSKHYRYRYMKVVNSATLAQSQPIVMQSAPSTTEELNVDEAAEVNDIVALAEDGFFSFSQDLSQSQPPAVPEQAAQMIESIVRQGGGDGVPLSKVLVQCGSSIGASEATISKILEQLAEDGAIYSIGDIFHAI